MGAHCARECATVHHLKGGDGYFFFFFLVCAFSKARSYRCLLPLCTSDARRRRRLFLPWVCSNPHWCGAGPAIRRSTTTIFRRNIYDINIPFSVTSAASAIRRNCRCGRGYDGLYLPSLWLHLHYFLPTVYHRLSGVHSCILYARSRPVERREEESQEPEERGTPIVITDDVVCWNVNRWALYFLVCASQGNECTTEMIEKRGEKEETRWEEKKEIKLFCTHADWGGCGGGALGARGAGWCRPSPGASGNRASPKFLGARLGGAPPPPPQFGFSRGAAARLISPLFCAWMWA